MKICPICNTEYEDDVNFCKKCGAKCEDKAVNEKAEDISLLKKLIEQQDSKISQLENEIKELKSKLTEIDKRFENPSQPIKIPTSNLNILYSCYAPCDGNVGYDIRIRTGQNVKKGQQICKILGKCILRAPKSGHIELKFRSGNRVMTGEELFTIY